MQSTKTVAILTQGCKVNQYESEAIAEAFEKTGFAVVSSALSADVYVINTCTVTAESDRKAGQLIRRVKAQNKDALILVTGCFAQVAPDMVAAIPGVHYICGNDRKLSVVEMAVKLLKESTKPEVPAVSVGVLEHVPFESMHITRFDRTRAYVKIEDGCENRCAYCAIPGARGNVRSKPLADVVAEVKGLVAGGCREVVLTGIETASYGRDLDTSLIELLEAVDAVEGLERMRLGSLYPTLITKDFAYRLATLSHLAPHFHLSVQSGSTAVLRTMNRRYTAEEAMLAIERLRRAIPHAELTADFIVGFPGERDEHFAETVSFVEQADFLQIHVFSYSRRKGTVAASMPTQVPQNIKKARSAALISTGKKCHLRRLTSALENPHRLVLFETFEDNMAMGHTDSFLEVAVPSARPLHGELRPVTLLEIKNDRLIAELEDEA